jgi:hypothetical protein
VRPVVLSLVSLLLMGAGASARATQVDGLVWFDRDGNGRQDAGEPGVAGVRVSNGRDIVETDPAGRYRLRLADGDTLFLVKPPQYAVPQRNDGMPDFWRHHFPGGSPALRFGGVAAQAADPDFALRERLPGPATLEVLLFGDPQPASLAEVDHYARDIVAPLVGERAATLGLSLGDIVDDDLSLYPAMNEATRRLGVPWLHAAGNHDIDLDATDDRHSLLTFRNTYGPDTFAWEEPQASFVVLDDVIHQPGQRPAYIGGLREDQFAFLEAYLATQPAARPIVLALHIPLFDTRPEPTFRAADRERLFALLQRFEHVLVLSSHTHVQQHVMHGPAQGWQGARPLHEYNVGASCGGFWGGVADAAGIPDGLMADGTPNGYARLLIDSEGGFAMYWHVARAADDPTIALHAPRVLRYGAYPGVSVWANVFMGQADTRVEYRVGERAWQPMQRAAAADPRVQAENLADDLSDALRGDKRVPQAKPSAHLWQGVLPTDLPPGEHRIEVRAFDRWRGEIGASTQYRLEAAP